MSRYVVELEGNREFVYGFDNVLGYFYELWDNTLGEEDYERVVEDKSYLFSKLTKEEMLEKDFDGDKKNTASYAGVERCQYMGQSEGKNILFRRGRS